MRGNFTYFVMAIFACVTSCSLPAKRLPIPDVSAIDQMVVSRGDVDRVIKERKAAEKFLAFLRTHNDGWEKPWYTFPNSKYTVTLQRGEETLLVVWVGANWIGGSGLGDYSENRLRLLSTQDLVELHEILGIPKGELK